MSAQSKQIDMLTVAARIASICEQSQASNSFTSSEKEILKAREDEVMGAASVISTLVSGSIEDVAERDAIFNAVIKLSMGAFDVGMITHTSDASQKFYSAKNTSPARDAAKLKRNRRDQILENELGGLISQGLKGEKLRKALLKIFADEKVEKSKAEPGPRLVGMWVKQYRESGKWRNSQQS